MARLLIHVEGQTEETFVNEVLQDYLLQKGYESVSARLIGNARSRGRRGRIQPWPPTRADVIRHLSEDGGLLVAIMVDFYALPQHGYDAWPGRSNAAGSPHLKGASVEDALKKDLMAEIPDLQPQRFIPFVVMHEFEGLLFSDCKAFAHGIGRADLEPQLTQIRSSFETPEHINDSWDTCPSKRIESLVPGYDKPLFGSLAALEIGLERIRAECPHFRAWLERLAAIAG